MTVYGTQLKASWGLNFHLLPNSPGRVFLSRGQEAVIRGPIFPYIEVIPGNLHTFTACEPAITEEIIIILVIIH